MHEYPYEWPTQKRKINWEIQADANMFFPIWMVKMVQTNANSVRFYGTSSLSVVKFRKCPFSHRSKREINFQVFVIHFFVIFSLV